MRSFTENQKNRVSMYNQFTLWKMLFGESTRAAFKWHHHLNIHRGSSAEMGNKTRFLDSDVADTGSPSGLAVESGGAALLQQSYDNGAKMEEKRSKTMIKNEFQHRLILATLLITLITLNIIIMAATMMDYMYGDSDGIFNPFTVSVAVMEVVAVVIVFFISKRISFRIAGPVYAIERTLNKMREGDLAQQLKLREGDHFGEVADAINELLSVYRERLASAQRLLEQNGELSAEQRRELEETLRWFTTRRED